MDPFVHVDRIVEGFSKAYRLLARYRAELLSEDGPIARFADDRVRIILRDSQAYATLLQSSYHPDVLRSALDRDRLFDRLWIDAGEESGLDRGMSAEHNDLWNDDIPVFTTSPGTKGIQTGSGVEIKDFLDEPSLFLVRRRLLNVSEDELERQIRIIKASFAISPAVGN